MSLPAWATGGSFMNSWLAFLDLLISIDFLALVVIFLIIDTLWPKKGS